MTAKALIKQSELMRLAAVAKRNNITIEVEAEGYTIRLHANSAAPPATVDLKPEDFTSLAEWQAWRNRERAREAQSRWDIPYHEMPPEPIQPPLDHREARAMEYLLTVGAEKPVGWYRLKNVGRRTQKKLLDRGYIGVGERTDRLGNPSEVWLTKAGQKAMRDLDAHRSKYPVL